MEKERLEKFERFHFLNRRIFYFRDVFPIARQEMKADILEVWGNDEVEIRGLLQELYPDPPKDLMEDVKKRMEAYKRAKIWREGFISLSFRQRIKNLFRRKKLV